MQTRTLCYMVLYEIVPGSLSGFYEPTWYVLIRYAVCTPCRRGNKMTTTFKRLSKVFVCRNQEAGANSTSTAREESKTASSADEPSSIELLGIDALTNHMHVKR